MKAVVAICILFLGNGMVNAVTFKTTSSFDGISVSGTEHTWALDIPSLFFNITTDYVTVTTSGSIDVTLTPASSTPYSRIVLIFSNGRCDVNPNDPPFQVDCVKAKSTDPLIITALITGLDISFNQSVLSMTASTLGVAWNYPDATINLQVCDKNSVGAANANTVPNSCNYSCNAEISCEAGFVNNNVTSTCLANAVWSPAIECQRVTCNVIACEDCCNASDATPLSNRPLAYEKVLNVECCHSSGNSSNFTCMDVGDYAPDLSCASVHSTFDQTTVVSTAVGDLTSSEIPQAGTVEAHTETTPSKTTKNAAAVTTGTKEAGSKTKADKISDTDGGKAGISLACIGGVCYICCILVHFVFRPEPKPVIGLSIAYGVGALVWVVGVILCFATDPNMYVAMTGGQIAGTVLGTVGIGVGIGGMAYFFVNTDGK